ncbi:MAG: DUF2802 domain-containing protein [Desulfobacterales bacterium]|jgi:hypothetical protein
MQTIGLLAEFNVLLDMLAIVCCLIIILFLRRNHRRYGSLIAPNRRDGDIKGFAAEVALQMIAQQSQKAYDNIQRSLNREFESLRMVAGGSPSVTYAENKQVHRQQLSPLAALSREQRYRNAEQMIAQGADASQIMAACGLGEGELMLLRGLQKLA